MEWHYFDFNPQSSYSFLHANFSVGVGTCLQSMSPHHDVPVTPTARMIRLRPCFLVSRRIDIKILLTHILWKFLVSSVHGPVVLAKLSNKKSTCCQMKYKIIIAGDEATGLSSVCFNTICVITNKRYDFKKKHSAILPRHPFYRVLGCDEISKDISEDC